MTQTALIKTIYAVLFVITVGFALNTVYVGSTHVNQGQTLAQREAKLRELAEEKHLLQQELATSTSLSAVAQLASAQGFVPVQKTIALTTTELVASR
jgi:cell division protein FtsL